MKHLLLFMLGVALAHAAVAAPSCGDPTDTLFVRTELVPENVRIYVHIEGEKDLRAKLEHLPVADWAEEAFQGGQFVLAWNHLAGLAGANASGLLDEVMGDDLTFMVRGIGDAREFVLMTKTSRAIAKDLFRQFRAEIHGPKDGTPYAELPEHRLLMVHAPEGYLLVCSSDRPVLLEEVRERLSGGAPRQGARTLANAEPIRQVAACLGAGQIGIFFRHQQPLGGWSVASLRFDGLHLKLQHRARFAKDAFVRPITQTDMDPSVLSNFHRHVLLAMMEPTDIGESEVEMFIAQMLGGLSLIDGDLRQNLGDRRILAVSEVEGRLEKQGVNMLLPTGAVCLEVRNGDEGERQLDKRLTRLALQLNQRGKGRFELNVPQRRQFIPREARLIELGPYMEQLDLGLDFLTSVDLCWRTVDSPHGTFCVVATHPQILDETMQALQRETMGPRVKGRWANVGVANGIRIAHHLASLGERAMLLADPKDAEAFAANMSLISRLAFGIKSINWKMARPCIAEMNLEVDVELTPALSAENE